MGIENARYQMRWNLYKPPSTHLFLHFLPLATHPTQTRVSTHLQVSTHLSLFNTNCPNQNPRPRQGGKGEKQTQDCLLFHLQSRRHTNHSHLLQWTTYREGLSRRSGLRSLCISKVPFPAVGCPNLGQENWRRWEGDWLHRRQWWCALGIAQHRASGLRGRVKQTSSRGPLSFGYFGRSVSVCGSRQSLVGGWIVGEEI